MNQHFFGLLKEYFQFVCMKRENFSVLRYSTSWFFSKYHQSNFKKISESIETIEIIFQFLKVIFELMIALIVFCMTILVALWHLTKFGFGVVLILGFASSGAWGVLRF